MGASQWNSQNVDNYYTSEAILVTNGHKSISAIQIQSEQKEDYRYKAIPTMTTLF